MTEELRPEDVEAAARVAAVRLSDRDRRAAGGVLSGLLRAVRGLPAPPDLEPMLIFAVEQEAGRERR